jgi:hypothetical protein
VGETPELGDLRDVDTFFVDSMRRILDYDRETFDAAFAGQMFVVQRSDGTTMPLRDGGDEIPVTYACP